MGYDKVLVEKLVSLVRETKEIKLEDTARSLTIDEDGIMKIAAILDKHDIIKINYTPAGEAFFKPGPNVNKMGDEIVKEESSDTNNITSTGDKTEKVDNLITELREKISEKRVKKYEKQ